MKRLVIARPFPIAALASGFANSARLLTPDPKEAVFVSGAATTNIDVDLGSAKSIDTFFLGYVAAGCSVTITGGTGAYTTTTYATAVAPQGSELFTPDLHIPVVLDPPVTARYVRFAVTTPAGGGKVGVVAVGSSFQAFWGHEYGSGRPIEDTGSSERLFSGGFGINRGVTAGGYQWTFGDLTDAEVDKLYAIARDRGSTGSVLVVEDPTLSFGLNERTHWGLFGRLEAYERQVPGASRYNLTVRDWV